MIREQCFSFFSLLPECSAEREKRSKQEGGRDPREVEEWEGVMWA